MSIIESAETPLSARRAPWSAPLLAGPAGVASALTVVVFVPPGGDVFGLLAAIAAWIVAGVIWLGALVVLGRRHKVDAWGLVFPLVAVVTAALVVLDVPLRVAFLVSEPALTSYVRSLPEGDVRVRAGRFVGLFPVRDATRTGGVVSLDVSSEAGMLIQCGLTYAPGREARDLDVTTADHLAGDWYATCLDFD